MERRKTPTKKTPPNCASFAGESARAESPEMPDETLPAPATAAALTEPAAAAAFSLATCALAAACALASESFFWDLLWSSLAIWPAFFPFSDSAVDACEAPSETRPKPWEIWSWNPFACSPHSNVFARSAALATFCRASFVASATCFFTFPAAFLAQDAQFGWASPRSAASISLGGGVVSGGWLFWGKTSYAALRAFSTTFFLALSAHEPQDASWEVLSPSLSPAVLEGSEPWRLLMLRKKRSKGEAAASGASAAFAGPGTAAIAQRRGGDLCRGLCGA
mmetsp:Transcript_110482/g.293491  ORF Transcript_110482/g.293491 Transcript_110482/m.293491 type:complete len:279 (+) Transcript_110482:522-1358(+)